MVLGQIDRRPPYLGTSDTFDHALAGFSEVFADQNEHDHATFGRAVAATRLEAQTGA